MDQSGPTGMPPPSGVTDADEAKKPESGETSLEGKADTVPPTATGSREIAADIPTAHAAQQNANTSIAIDAIGEEEVLEGSGQADPNPSPEPSKDPAQPPLSSAAEPVPPPKILEEQTHNAMLADETGHVHLANGKRIGSPITPSTSGTNTPVDDLTTTSATGDTRPPMPAVSEAPTAAGAKGGTELIEPSNVAADPEDEKAADEAIPVVPLAVKGTPAKAAETGSLAKPGSRAGSVANPPATEEEEEEKEDADVTGEIVGASRDEAKAGGGAVKEVEGTSEGQALPGTRTQEQEAGKGEMVGESVAD